MRNVSNMFKVSNIDTRTFLASIVNFEHISHFILLLLLLNSNKSMLVGSENMQFQTKNLFSVTEKYIGPMGWENLLGYMFSSLFTQNKFAKRYFFMTEFGKDKSNSGRQLCLVKYAQTRIYIHLMMKSKNKKVKASI